MPLSPQPRTPQPRLDEGFALIGLIVAIFIILLALSVAAPTVARALRREREVEAVHRADEYVNAIRRYHIKTGAYPGSIEQLEKTNNVRYLRQKYNDPMTGKPDWRLIKVGENKTTVKGFFGQPLAGLAGTGIGGSSMGSASSGIGSAGATGGSSTANAAGASTGSAGSSGATTSPSGSGATDAGSTSSFGGSGNTGLGASGATGGLGSSGAGAGGLGSSGFGSSGSGGFGSQSGSGSAGFGSPFLGVGLPTAGEAIVVVNEQTTYPEWEFLYDPRIEQLRAKVNILGGGMSSTSSSSLGALAPSASTPSTSPTAPSTSPTTAPQ